ncbi:GntR family transcriptional regulator [Salipiger aestuarii]|uniref:DNA-binding GntR family transcriptional regulator n=1 Tax=Salipiger aestuarii TaxID=568098 RepID=A0A327YS72_9RHOB|nr:GntR family transcriptional regulator [Salipiger aestuarii]EIE49518.1 GntR family transcriptional regulator [Citreicella sp. 357]KAA8610113.1 GntR family transcriptional regulator [Salipiger aestuarii]KAA8616080.1 GntR family transcriptional regulator [Salipiger aestuarii]KAB2543312.1 GntR family transcriptional regulator [Salipiger aestuarii]RAK24024.1 DNA-binding GntR family transcriptional regulator [Salipiger aestuarii]
MTAPSSVDRVYDALRDRAIRFAFKPGERINESALTRALNVSRTPLREALNRLAAEGFLTLRGGQGFFCRALDPGQVLELYQLRTALEVEALRQGIIRADDATLATFGARFETTDPAYVATTDPAALVHMDEAFHLSVAALSGNGELCRMLSNVNARIRFVRMVNLRELRTGRNAGDSGAHRRIAAAVLARDIDAGESALRGHIERRGEETRALVRLAYCELYVPE